MPGASALRRSAQGPNRLLNIFLFFKFSLQFPIKKYALQFCMHFLNAFLSCQARAHFGARHALFFFSYFHFLFFSDVRRECASTHGTLSFFLLFCLYLYFRMSGASALRRSSPRARRQPRREDPQRRLDPQAQECPCHRQPGLRAQGLAGLNPKP